MDAPTTSIALRSKIKPLRNAVSNYSWRRYAENRWAGLSCNLPTIARMTMEISNLISPDFVFARMKAAGKKQVLQELSEKAFRFLIDGIPLGVRR